MYIRNQQVHEACHDAVITVRLNWLLSTAWTGLVPWFGVSIACHIIRQVLTFAPAIAQPNQILRRMSSKLDKTE